MLLLRRPDDAAIRRFLDSQRARPFAYDGIGSTRGTPPPGYAVDHHRVALGRGFATFERASAALRCWRMFELGWVELFWPSTPIEIGATVAILARLPGLWSLNASRVVYVIDEQEPIRRFGFAYGTLPAHVERGEERFTVELGTDDRVWYDLFAFSRPHAWYARAGLRFSRAFQKRFARGSLAAMVRATG
jgi:uncharacterized protein (UPF0548 family)